VDILETLSSALEARDPLPVLGTFTEDIQLHSPALIGPEYRGRDLVASIATAAMQVLEEVHVTDLLRAPDATTAGVVFDARVGTQSAQGVFLVRTKDDHIGEITLLLRPLPALQAFVSRMAELGAQPALDARKS
jgi:hypothetical protein